MNQENFRTIIVCSSFCYNISVCGCCFDWRKLEWNILILQKSFMQNFFSKELCFEFTTFLFQNVKSYILVVKRNILTSDYVKRFWALWFTRASVLIVVAFGLCHTLRLITNFIEMFCDRRSLPRVSKPRTSDDMDGTLQDLQGPNFFFEFTRSGDFSCSNKDTFWQST